MPEPLSFLGGADDPSAALRERTRRFPGGAELTLDLAHREWVGLRAKGFLHPLASKQASKKEINQARNNKTKAAALQGPIHLLSHPLTKPKTGEPTAWAQGLGEREREREREGERDRKTTSTTRRNRDKNHKQLCQAPESTGGGKHVKTGPQYSLNPDQQIQLAQLMVSITQEPNM